MAKGLLEIKFTDIEKMLLKQCPELSNTDLAVACAEVNNLLANVTFKFNTNKPVKDVSYLVADASVSVQPVSI